MCIAPGTLGDTKKELNPLELEFQVVVNWELICSSARAAKALNLEPSLPPVNVILQLFPTHKAHFTFGDMLSYGETVFTEDVCSSELSSVCNT